MNVNFCGSDPLLFAFMFNFTKSIKLHWNHVSPRAKIYQNNPRKLCPAAFYSTGSQLSAVAFTSSLLASLSLPSSLWRPRALERFPHARVFTHLWRGAAVFRLLTLCFLYFFCIFCRWQTHVNYGTRNSRKTPELATELSRQKAENKDAEAPQVRGLNFRRRNRNEPARSNDETELRRTKSTAGWRCWWLRRRQSRKTQAAVCLTNALGRPLHSIPSSPPNPQVAPFIYLSLVSFP